MADTAVLDTPAPAVTTSTEAAPPTPVPAPVQATGTPPPDKTTAPPTAPPPVDPDYIARAGRWKMSEDDIRAIPRDVFERMNAAADAEIIENLARIRQVQPSQAGQPNQPSPAAAAPAPGAANADAGPFRPIELKFDETDEDSPVVTHARAINDGMTKNLNDLYQHVSSQFTEIAAALQEMREFNDYAILDRHITQLGPEWKDVFGEGATIDLDAQSPLRSARDTYRKAIMEHLNLDASLGRARNTSEAMLRARYRLHGPKIAAIERSKREAKAVEVAKSLPAPTGTTNGRANPLGLRESFLEAGRQAMGAR